jgi:hypothetical protein
MCRAVVTGGLGFLGFELCLAILEEGFPVVAADTEEKTGERWLEVGRNANITYQPLHKKLPAEFSGTRLYLNLYDFCTMNKADNQLNEVKEFVGKNKGNFESASILMPSVISNRIGKEKLTSLLEFLESQLTNHNTVYIPTLFGPHQPDSFLFQQLISKTEDCSEYSDDPRSAIFVKDAAGAILNMKGNSNPEKVQLVSDSPDSWKESLLLLGCTDNEIRREHPVGEVVPSGLKKIVVKSSSSLEDVLELQRKC